MRIHWFGVPDDVAAAAGVPGRTLLELPDIA
jgi:hypothetical protein